MKAFVQMKRGGWGVILLLVYLLTSPAVRADLTAVVTPGYQFPVDGSVAPSYDLLNLLALPTVAIYGTVGGSNTLAVGSVTGTQLSSSVADGSTIGFNANVPPGLQVLAAGIIGPGLKTQSATNLMLHVDTNYFQLATNTIANTNDTSTRQWLTLKAQSLADTNISATAGIQPGKLAITSGRLMGGGLPAYTTNGYAMTNASEVWVGTGLELRLNTVVRSFTNGGTVTTITNTAPTLSLLTNEFTATNITFTTSAGMITNMAHGLPGTPSVMKWVAVCLTNDVGYEVGDEVPTADFDGNTATYFCTGANATNVFICGSGGVVLANKYTGSRGSNVTPARWRLKVYARP